MAFSISKDLITQLVKNYFAYTQTTDIETGMLRPLNPQKDSYTIWFSKDEVDQLFAVNNPDGKIADSQLGLRVYLGQHWNTPLENLVKDELAAQGIAFDEAKFKGQACVVLVPTLKNEAGDNVDLLQANGPLVSAVPVAGNGEDFGGICPPPPACSGVLIKI